MSSPDNEKDSLAARTGKFFSPLNYIALAIIFVAIVATLAN